MEKSVHSGPNRILSGRRLAGFSLVEVVLSIGIFAFAFVSVMGLIPVGLNTFQKAKNVSISNDIARGIISELQQNNFTDLVSDSDAAIANFTREYYGSGGRKYSEQGEWDVAPKIYWVNVRIAAAAPIPMREAAAGFAGGEVNTAMVTIQVAFNPGNRDLAKYYDDAGGASDTDSSKPLRNLWSGAYRSAPGAHGAVPIQTYTTYIARNTF